jgi:DNA polymerase-3 subunit epsilon
MFRFGLSQDGKKYQAIRFDGYSEEESDVSLANENERIAVVLDVETTGLNQASDEIIEIGARKLVFDKESGFIAQYGPAFQSLQEPSRPLSSEIIKLTGITDAELKGHSIDWQEFDAYIGDAAIIIAHNASFDRPFVDRCSKTSPQKIWGCSVFHMNWQDWFTSSKLDYLGLCHGFFFESHRAINDVDAVIRLLSFEMPDDESCTYLYRLLQNAKEHCYWVSAINSPIETKDVLKQRYYRWNGKVWRKKVLEGQLEEEKAFLSVNVYSGKGFLGDIEQVALRDNFKL